MIRNERNTVRRLLQAAHSATRDTVLPPAWGAAVMADICRLEPRRTVVSELERLAPRFTAAAAALCCIGLIAATWSLSTLPGQVYMAYAARAYTLPSFPWASM
jgi:hypothetical protein